MITSSEANFHCCMCGCPLEQDDGVSQLCGKFSCNEGCAREHDNKCMECYKIAALIEGAL